MLDLKAKLLAAGLVTEEQVKRVEAEKKDPAWHKRLEALKSAGKSEQYDAIRGWVDRHRIDSKTAVPSEQATRFHFQKSDGAIGHITLEPDVHAKLAAGEAGIVAFMGHNGLEHAVVPADLARDISYIKPEWLRSAPT
jgi:uncharacterized protein YaiL (DUF2058 family)